MVKWFIAAILLLPVAEIATFVLVGVLIGFGWAFVLMLATSIAGFLVLRRVERGRFAYVRVAIAENDVSAFEADAEGSLTVLAGTLLMLPGFLTDLAGALLLIGPVRRRSAAAFHRAMMGPVRSTGDGSVVDLAPDEWKQEPDRKASRDLDKPGAA
jgi:UPF0716 protein FxsA